MQPGHLGAQGTEGGSRECRSCGSVECDGACWGFFGGTARLRNQSRSFVDDHAGASAGANAGASGARAGAETGGSAKRPRLSKGQRAGKQGRRAVQIAEELRLRGPPDSDLDPLSGLRRPKPVRRVMEAVCKGRWQNRSLLDVCVDEFPIYGDHGAWSQRIAAGCISINGKVAGEAQVLRNGDVLRHEVHWHEPPVRVPPRIWFRRHELPTTPTAVHNGTSGGSSAAAATGSEAGNSLEVWAVDKPATVPCHSVGQYFTNALLTLLEAQENLPPRSLTACHRLDRLVSGLVVVAPSAAAATATRQWLEGGHCRKTYLARVAGRFPETPAVARTAWGEPLGETDQAGGTECTCRWERLGYAAIEWHCPSSSPGPPSPPSPSSRPGTVDNPDTDGVKDACEAGFVLVDCRMSTVDMDGKIRGPDPLGKTAVSLFAPLSYDPSSDTTLLRCRPVTGRTHQLRVHLQFLGFPIANDALYGGDRNLRGLPSATSDFASTLGSCKRQAQEPQQVEASNSAAPSMNSSIGGTSGVCVACSEPSEVTTEMARLGSEGTVGEEKLRELCRCCCYGESSIFRWADGFPIVH